MKPNHSAPEKPGQSGRVSRYQRLLSQQKKGGLPVPKKSGKNQPDASADSYQIIAQAIRVMLREP